MSQPATIRLTFPEPDIAVLTFDLPGRSVNLLTRSVLDELAAQLDALSVRTELAGVILASGKPGNYLAGADLQELAARLPTLTAESIVAGSRRGQQLLGRLAELPALTVAAVDGVCVGGGAELASWCDRRLMSSDPRTEVGFPEVQLGILPGWGGTARLPRLIGLGPAIEWITSGQRYSATAAQKAGWADEVTPSDQLLPAAIRQIRAAARGEQLQNERRRLAEPLRLSVDELALLRLAATDKVRQQTKGQYPAPEVALELLLEAAPSDLLNACQRESTRLAQLLGSPVNRALINVFFLQDRVKKDSGLSQADVRPRTLDRVAVVGAGIMGCGIVAAHVKRELPILMTDASEEALRRGAAGVLEEVSYDRETKTADARRALRFGPLLRAVPEVADLAGCDLVIEAIVEHADPKRALFTRLESLVAPNAILATNTSTIPISSLAEKLEHPARFCGMHFFNPVRRMQLVEVIRGRQTSDETIATAVAHAKRIGKMPIVVNDGPGFLVNRLLFPYLNEAIELFSEGAELLEIDEAAKQFGMPLGPFELYDMVGLDTSMHCGRVLWDAFKQRVCVSPVIPALIKAGRLGQKNGVGFFRYDGSRKTPETDPAATKILAVYRRGDRRFTRDELIARLFLPMLLEATRALEDQIVRDPRDVDFALIFGLGFPSFRGGLLFWADVEGAERLLRQVGQLAHLGPRMAPTELLVDMAKTGRKFYGQAASVGAVS